VFQGRNQRRDNVNTVMKLRIPYQAQNFSVACGKGLSNIPYHVTELHLTTLLKFGKQNKFSWSSSLCNIRVPTSPPPQTLFSVSQIQMLSIGCCSQTQRLTMRTQICYGPPLFGIIFTWRDYSKNVNAPVLLYNTRPLKLAEFTTYWVKIQNL
jgi:hypothetical protein